MPFAGKEHEHVACSKPGEGVMIGFEEAFSFRNIKQLELVEHASALDVKVITVGVAFCGIVFAG